MTTPTPEAAEIVAGLLPDHWAISAILQTRSDGSPTAPYLYAFAEYVTEEPEVTDAMVEAGVKAFNAYHGQDKAGAVRAAFRAMIAAKHGQRKAVDPLVEAIQEVWQYAKGCEHIPPMRADMVREALAKRGKMIADIPEPVFTPEEEADLVAQINGNWYLQPNEPEAPTIDEEAVVREAREAWEHFVGPIKFYDFGILPSMKALIATTRELHLLRAKVGGEG